MTSANKTGEAREEAEDRVVKMEPEKEEKEGEQRKTKQKEVGLGEKCQKIGGSEKVDID